VKIIKFVIPNMNIKNVYFKTGLFLFLLFGLMLGPCPKSVLAQESQSVLYIPLIGITAVPEPLTLPKGEGNVTFNYAVKNFLQELPLTEIQVTDDSCSPVKFVTGDDNGNSQLDYGETWRYRCTVKLTKTIQSTATATGTANNITATHHAYSTVVVGSANPAPLVSIINVTKVAYPLSLPAEGGDITFTYKVTNPGIIPLSDVTVTDNKCTSISGKLGDTNGNNLLDTNEVWIYTCKTHLTQTTTNRATVKAFANGLEAVNDVSITVKVALPAGQPKPSLPNTGSETNLKMRSWLIMAGVLAVLVVLSLLTRKRKPKYNRKKSRYPRKKQEGE